MFSCTSCEWFWNVFEYVYMLNDVDVRIVSVAILFYKNSVYELESKSCSKDSKRRNTSIANMLVWIARNVVWEVFVVILRVQLPPLPITIRCKLTEQKDWLKLYLTGSKIQSRERISGFKTSWKRGERQTFIYISGQFVRSMSKNGNHTHRSFMAGNACTV